MKLLEAVGQYVTHKQSMGMRFNSERRILKSFCCHQEGKDLAQIGPRAVLEFIAGNGPPTRFWHRKHETLTGFYRFAIARGYVDGSPLPKHVPKLSRLFVPYIFSRVELKRLLDAAEPCFANPRCRIDAATYRTLLLLLYGAGLRIGEAVSLTLADVDLDAALLQIRESKFYKSRLVPVGADLQNVLARHITRRHADRADSDAPLFVRRTGNRLTRAAAENAFCRLRTHANVLRHDGARYQPRLHDLRHTAATHRLQFWYESGADVQRLLPQLATYLGHVHISGTQNYLALTPEILRQASQRFERYAVGDHHE
jgi:site-specific recombinase XerD